VIAVRKLAAGQEASEESGNTVSLSESKKRRTQGLGGGRLEIRVKTYGANGACNLY